MTSRRAVPALLAIAALVAAGCTEQQGDAPGAASPTSTPTATAPAETAPAEAGSGASTQAFDGIPDLVREVAPSTVSVVVQLRQQGVLGQGVGSGVIWHADGIIVTNHHVVVQGQELEVVLANGERFAAEVLASDERTDLAALQIDAEGLPAATFAQELPEVGELAVAIGNPLGLENTATAGIVSGVDRSLPVEQGGPALVGLLQTDASISSGNSGGALVNDRGEVIGVSVAALGNLPMGVAENLGFAIPSTTVTPVMEQLVSDGRVSHPYLGIGGATLTPQVADRFAIDADRGVIIRAVETGSPADRAGLAQGDVITAVDDERIGSLGDLLGTLRRHQPGDTITVTIQRGQERDELEVTLGELPDEPVLETEPPAP